VLGWTEELLALQSACAEHPIPAAVAELDGTTSEHGSSDDPLALDEDAGDELTSEALATIVQRYSDMNADGEDDLAALAPQGFTVPPPGYIADILETGRLALERDAEASEKDRAAIAVDAVLDATPEDHEVAIMTGRRSILEDALELFPVTLVPTVRQVVPDTPASSTVTVALGADEIPYESE
jgi:hypothetical protein